MRYRFKVWLHNVRGIKSKIESLKDKIDEVQPTVICITETHLAEAEDLKLDGYEVYRNDRNNEGGGVLIAVRTEIENICTIVHKGSNVGEMLWVVMDNGKAKVRIGVVYAPQESRTSKEQLETMYEEINDQILQARERHQRLLLMGDFNGKIGDVVRGNKSEVTTSGRLLLKLAKQENLAILNTLEVCNGTWTRTEGDSRSVIDYILMDKRLKLI